MAKMTLPALFQSHMMLQRDKPVPIEGKIRGARTVRICLGDEEYTASVKNGQFHFLLPPRPAAWNLTMTLFIDRNEKPDMTFTNINVGDIWMAMGQSNMEFFLRYDADWNRVRQWPKNPAIRMYNVPRIAYEGQRRDMSDYGFWFDEGDEAWQNFSAPGYSFARTIQPDLGIPVGIIGCNWGGTPASAWIEESYLEKEPLCHLRDEYESAVAQWEMEELRRRSEQCWEFEDSYRHVIEWHAVMHGLTPKEQRLWVTEHAADPVMPLGPWHHCRPSGLYHTMVETVAPFPVKGLLWYQGESDAEHAHIYDQTMAALVDCLRGAWNDPSLPFLFVQLAPFGEWLECSGKNYRLLRERQESAARNIPRAWMASIMDLGSRYDIHPKFKMEVGRRLGLLARGHVYGFPGVCDAPQMRSAGRDVNDPHLLHFYFDHAGGGLHGDEQTAEAFQITQRGELLPVSDFWFEQDSLTLRLLGAGEGAPLEVRYAQEDYCEVHIWNSEGLCAKPFSCGVL